MPIKYQENTKKFGIEIPNTDFGFSIFLVYKIFGNRLTSLVSRERGRDNGGEGERGGGWRVSSDAVDYGC